MSKIKSIKALEILDSRGNPTIRVWVTTKSGAVGIASVPSGASTGTHEALELRDGDKKRYRGKGVKKAVRNVEKIIAKKLKGMEISEQRKIDEAMLKLDGTSNKKKLGANAILGVSLACAHAGAIERGVPLYKYIRSTFRLKLRGWQMPMPTMNIINGGVHADSGLDVQEFMIIPQARKLHEQTRMGSEVFQTLKSVLKDKGFATSVGDEGGFAPKLGKSEKGLEVIASAIKKAGYKLGKDVLIGMDVAASEFYKNKKYYFEGSKLSSDQLTKKIVSWMKKYPFLSVEDPLSEDDWDGWPLATELIAKAGPNNKASVVGDDLFVTNKDRLERGIKNGVANAILIKVNQIGSLSETIDTIKLAKKHGYKVSVSHRSGETADTTIADLAVAVQADYIKTGSLSRSERVEKYNRLMEIESEV